MRKRSARLTDEVAGEIVRLAIRQVPHAEIARRTKVQRRTVERVLERTRSTLALIEDTRKVRTEAVAVYREVQRTAWEAVENALKAGRSPAMSLAEVRLSQARIDALLGLEVKSAEDPAGTLIQFKQIVVQLIQDEAPDLGPRLAQKLLEAGEAHGHSTD